MPVPQEKRTSAIFCGTVFLTGLAVGIGLGALGVYCYAPKAEASSVDGPLDASRNFDKVVALGRIEPSGGILSLGVPVPDRLRRLLVAEGQPVEKDDALAVLDSEVMRKLELQLAAIQREQADERLKAIDESGTAQIAVEELQRDRLVEIEPLEIESLKSKIAFLEMQERNARKDYDRYLAAGDTVADQDKEKQKLAMQQATTELIATRSQLKKLQDTSSLNRKVANARVQAARAEWKQSRRAISRPLLDTQIKQADERLKETQIHAPCRGTILRVFVREGELVHGQAILQMANVDKMIVRTEVYETDIQYVKVGQAATVTSSIFTKNKNALSGKVEWISGSVGKAQVVPLDPRAAVDNRVVEVKVALDDPKPVAKLIGHQVRVEIQTGEH